MSPEMWNSTICLVTTLMVGRARNCGSNTGEGNIFLSSLKSPAQLWGPTNHLFNGYLQMFRRRRAVSGSSFNMITHFKAVRTSGCTSIPQTLQVVMRMFGHNDDISFQKFLHHIREILIGGWGGGDITYIRMCSPAFGLMLPFTAQWHLGSMGYFSTPPCSCIRLHGVLYN
jgi:hypothetical protein